MLQADAVAYAHRHGIALQASPTNGQGTGTRIQVAPLPSRWSGVSIDDQLERFERERLPDLLQAGAPVNRIAPDGVICDLRNWHDRASFADSGIPTAVVSATGSEARMDAVNAHAVVTELASTVPVRSWSACAGLLRVEVSREHAKAAAAYLHERLLVART